MQAFGDPALDDLENQRINIVANAAKQTRLSHLPGRVDPHLDDREFVAADGCIGCRLHCPYMKMIDLNAVQRSLTEDVFPIMVEEDIMDGARRSLERMMAVPRDN